MRYACAENIREGWGAYYEGPSTPYGMDYLSNGMSSIFKLISMLLSTISM